MFVVSRCRCEKHEWYIISTCKELEMFRCMDGLSAYEYTVLADQVKHMLHNVNIL